MDKITENIEKALNEYESEFEPKAVSDLRITNQGGGMYIAEYTVDSVRVQNWVAADEKSASVC